MKCFRLLLLLCFVLSFSVQVFSQIERGTIENFKIAPDPFDKSRISYYINSEKLNPYDFEGNYRKGLLNLENELYEEAIINFRLLLLPQSNTVDRSDGWAEPYFYIGLCKSNLRELDSAVYYYNLAIDINPAYFEALNERGIIFSTFGEYDKALEDFEQAYVLNNTYAYAAYNIAHTYFIMGDFKLAKKQLKKSIRKFPENYYNYSLMGYIYMQESEYDKAIEYFSKSIEIYPFDPLNYYNRGLVNMLIGIDNFDWAQMAMGDVDFNEVIRLDSTFADVYFLKIMFGIFSEDSNSVIRNFYLGLKYSYFSANAQLAASVFEMEQYYLLDEMFNNPLLPESEKSLGEDYFYSYLIDDRISMNQAIKYSVKNPESIFVKRLIACHYLTLSDESLLTSAIESVLALDSTVAHLKWVLATIYMDHQRDKEVEELLCDLLEKDSLNEEYLYALGITYLRLSEYELAKKTYSKLIRIPPDHPIEYIYRATIYIPEGEFRAALNDINIAIKLEPDNSFSWYLRGKTYNLMGKPDSALVMLDQAKAFSPSYEPINEELIKSYIALNEFQNAETVIHEMIENDKENIHTWIQAGNYYLNDLEDYEAAEKHYEKMLKYFPNHPLALTVYGDYHQKIDECYKAIDYYDAALLADNTFYSPASSAAWCYYKIGLPDEAIEYCDLAISIDSTRAYPCYLKGFIYQKQEDYETSLAFFLKAAEIDETYASAWGNAGWTCYLMGDYEKCIDYSRVAVELDDEAYYAMANIALSYLRQGKTELSLDEYEAYYQKTMTLEDYDNSGAKADLKALIDEGIMVEEAQNILATYFHKE
jgi:tetratricopeptide (TPR) repeat protein